MIYYVSDVIKPVYELGALARFCMVEFGNEATVQSDLLRSILTMQIDLDKQGKTPDTPGDYRTATARDTLRIRFLILDWTHI